MAYIYVITNQNNGKQYVGKTEKVNAIDRFYEHIKDSQSETKELRPLYKAFNKYGVKNFEFEVLEEVDSHESTEREIYWIKTLNTYGSTGYNATLGGDGRTYLNYDKIVADYRQLQNLSEVARVNDCHPDSVAQIIKAKGLHILSGSAATKATYGIKVAMIDPKTGKVLQTFLSQIDGARFLIENGYSQSKSASSFSAKIGLVVRGKRKTCGGFIWKQISD